MNLHIIQPTLQDTSKAYYIWCRDQDQTTGGRLKTLLEEEEEDVTFPEEDVTLLEEEEDVTYWKKRKEKES